MTTNQFKELLKKFRACKSGRDWVQRQIKKGKSPKEIWEGCNNGHYLVWLSSMLEIFDFDKYYYFKINNCYYVIKTKKGYNNIKCQFVHKYIKYKDFHKAAIKALKQK